MANGLIVQKFGGTSVADAERVKAAAQRAVDTKVAGNDVIVVVSARGNTTDELLSMAHEITSDPSPREMDMLLATGEQISVALMAMAIHELGQDAISYTASQVGLFTDGIHRKAKIVDIGTERIENQLRNGKIVIVTGFQGINPDYDITTLGRGGSDLTAVALAAVLKAKACEIYTDVDGVYTADPRIVPNARKIERIAYDEMLELASMGAAVLQTRSVEFAKKYKVPVHVRSSLNNSTGTIISEEVKDMEDVVVSGAALNKNEAKITIRGVPDKPGQAARIFSYIAQKNINIDMIIQNISEDELTDVTFTVERDDLQNAKKVAGKIAEDIGAKGVNCDDSIAKLSVVGVGMRSHSGVADKMFGALAEAEVNIQMISTSEIKISCVIDEASSERALSAVHAAFDLDKE